ncbi:MAG: ABC transporter permease [Defluviitaleaceae bacterium]|nr:ABC transporter permease [Defluviitaleaceae bacterium]
MSVSTKRKLKKIFKNRQLTLGGVIVILFILLAIFAPLIAPFDPLEQSMQRRLQAPSGEHIMGTDNLGRDVFSRIVYGTRVSLVVGIASTLMGGIVGVFFGVIAGYYGKAVDTVIMRATDILLAFPGILLALAIVAILGSGTEVVIIAVAVWAVPSFARIVRGSTLAVKKLEYIDAIRAVGAGDFRIIFLHILPNVLSPIIVQATLNVGGAIVSAAVLSFLGVGTQAPTPEWGSMVSTGRQFMLENPHLVLFPGLAIFLLVVGINLFGDGLRDHLEPKKTK